MTQKLKVLWSRKYWIIPKSADYPPYELILINKVDEKRTFCKGCNTTRNTLAFYQDLGLKNLKIYHDNSTKSGLYSKAKGLPLTFLIDHEGNEVGRRDGPWEWDDSEVVEIIKSYKKFSIN